MPFFSSIIFYLYCRKSLPAEEAKAIKISFNCTRHRKGTRKKSNNLSRGRHDAVSEPAEHRQRILAFSPHRQTVLADCKDWITQFEQKDFVFAKKQQKKNDRANKLDRRFMERDRKLQNRCNILHMVIFLCVSRRSRNMKTFAQFLKNFLCDFKIYVAYVLTWLNFKIMFHNIRLYLLSNSIQNHQLNIIYSRIEKYSNDSSQTEKHHLGGFSTTRDSNTVFCIESAKILKLKTEEVLNGTYF